MKVKIMATKACSHRPNLEKELNDLGVPYELLFVEENPDAVPAMRFGIFLPLLSMTGLCFTGSRASTNCELSSTKPVPGADL